MNWFNPCVGFDVYTENQINQAKFNKECNGGFAKVLRKMGHWSQTNCN